MIPKYAWFGTAFLIGLVADQVSKYWIIDRLHYGERVWVMPEFLELTHVRNPGGIFSFLAQSSAELRMSLFVGAALVAIVLLIVFLLRHEAEERLSPMALGLILAGAVGNLADRLVHGEVIDFLNVHLWGGYVWPTFNIADSLIVVGTSILMLMLFLGDESGQTDPGEVSERAHSEGG
ncbi:MAG: signal peptidase II [Myxococcota bacterium]